MWLFAEDRVLEADEDELIVPAGFSRIDAVQDTTGSEPITRWGSDDRRATCEITLAESDEVSDALAEFIRLPEERRRAVNAGSASLYQLVVDCVG